MGVNCLHIIFLKTYINIKANTYKSRSVPTMAGRQESFFNFEAPIEE